MGDDRARPGHSATGWPWRPGCVTPRSPASRPSRSTGTPPASRWRPPTRRTATRRRCPSRATWRAIWRPTWRPLRRGAARLPSAGREGRQDAPGRPGGRRHPLPGRSGTVSSTSTRCDARWRPWPMRPASRPGSFRRLMRHSTLELTGRYTRPRAVDIEAAAGMLPSFGPRTRDRGTGRDRHRWTRITGKRLCPFCAHRRAVLCGLTRNW